MFVVCGVGPSPELRSVFFAMCFMFVFRVFVFSCFRELGLAVFVRMVHYTLFFVRMVHLTGVESC